MSSLNRTFSRRVPEDVKLIMKIPDKPHHPFRKIPHPQIHQLPLSNARKFTTQDASPSAKIEDSTILFYVTDTGKGIDPKFMPITSSSVCQGRRFRTRRRHRTFHLSQDCRRAGEIGAESEKDKRAADFGSGFPKMFPSTTHRRDLF